MVTSKQSLEDAPGDLASHFRWHGDAFTDGQVIDTITPKRATVAARTENHGQARRTGLGPHHAFGVVAGGVGLLEQAGGAGQPVIAQPEIPAEAQQLLDALTH